MENKNIEDLTVQLLKEIGEDPSREGLLRTPKEFQRLGSFLLKVISRILIKLLTMQFLMKMRKTWSL